MIYNMDEQLYAAMKEPGWEVRAGDAVYELSFLTQRYRYGRGGSLQIYKDTWEAGAHYTQNSFDHNCNPKDFCSYVEWAPAEKWSFSTNYMHRDEHGIPSTNIVTLQTDVEYPEKVYTEAEVGKSIFKKGGFEKGHKDTWAYRFETHGRFGEDAWFSLEKVYAGPYFNGYYQHMHLFATTLDFSLFKRWRLNMNVNQYNQNFDLSCTEDPWAPAPRQKQYSATLTYNMRSGMSAAFNGLLLRSEDRGWSGLYDFYQKWGGFSLSPATEAIFLMQSFPMDSKRII